MRERETRLNGKSGVKKAFWNIDRCDLTRMPFLFFPPSAAHIRARFVLRNPAADYSLPRLVSPRKTTRAMVHHILLFKLKPEVTPQKLEQMLLSTRMTLLKIPEVLSIKCGKGIDPASEWPFFIALDFESTDKMADYMEDPLHMKYVAEIINPHTTERLALDYETDPGKDVAFS